MYTIYIYMCIGIIGSAAVRVLALVDVLSKRRRRRRRVCNVNTAVRETVPTVIENNNIMIRVDSKIQNYTHIRITHIIARTIL